MHIPVRVLEFRHVLLQHSLVLYPNVHLKDALLLFPHAHQPRMNVCRGLLLGILPTLLPEANHQGIEELEEEGRGMVSLLQRAGVEQEKEEEEERIDGWN